MKKYIITILCVFSGFIGLHAQISISYSVGYGDYKMNDMSQLLDASLEAIQSSLPAGVSITDNFPAYIIHNLDATYSFNRHEVGLKGTYMTTGGKIAYADYSGKYYEKLTLNGYRIGAMYRFHFLRTQLGKLPFSIFGEVSPAITFTQLKYKALLSLPDYNVYETNPEDNVSTNETGFSIQPLIGGQLFITKDLFTSISIGYDFEFGSKLKTTNNILRADWSGFRINAGIGYKF